MTNTFTPGGGMFLDLIALAGAGFDPDPRRENIGCMAFWHLYADGGMRVTFRDTMRATRAHSSLAVTDPYAPMYLVQSFQQSCAAPSWQKRVTGFDAAERAADESAPRYPGGTVSIVERDTRLVVRTYTN